MQRFVVGGVAAVQRVGDGDQAALGAGPVGARLRLSSRALLLLGVLVLAQVGLEGRGCAQRRPRLPPRNSGTGPGLRSPPPSRPAATAPAGTRTARPVGAASRSTRCPRRPPPPAPRTAPPRPPRPRRQRASLRPPAGKRSVTAGGGGRGGRTLRSAPPPLACSSCAAGGGSRSGSARAWMTPLAAAMSHSTTAESSIPVVSCGGRTERQRSPRVPDPRRGRKGGR